MPTPDVEGGRKAALLTALREIQRQHDEREINTEQAHRDADAALIAYIDDLEVTRMFEAIERWYA